MAGSRSSSAIAGIDVGTYGSKGVLVGSGGEVIATATRSHGLDTPRPGWAEQDADAIWWADVVAIARDLVAAATQTGVAIEGLGVSAIGPTCLPVDRDGRPLRPSLLYGIDARAAEEIVEVEQELGAEQVLATCGSPLTSQAIGPKVRWLQRHEPHIWERTARVLTASSYLVHRLTGRYVVDSYSAAAQVPFYDLEAGTWSAKLVEPLLPMAMLPQIVPSTQVVGTIHRAAAEATGEASPTNPIAIWSLSASRIRIAWNSGFGGSV